MTDHAVVDDSGRIARPEAILARLGLTPGAKVDIEVLGDTGVLLHSAEAAPQFVEKNGVLVARGVPTEDLTDVAEREREDRLAQFISEVEP